MYPDVLLDLIGQYTDLLTYKQLIPVISKIFTEQKYQKYQNLYDRILADQIELEWNTLTTSIFELKDKVEKEKVKYFFIKHQYQTIQRIKEALKCCDIFISTDEQNLQAVNLSDNLQIMKEKCELLGKICKQFNSDISINVDVNIKSNGYHQFLSIKFKNGSYEVPFSDSKLSALFKLYIEVDSKFSRLFEVVTAVDAVNIFGSIFSRLGGSLANTQAENIIRSMSNINYDDEYQAFLELISFRKN